MALQSKTFSVKSSNGYTLKLVLTEESTDTESCTSLVSYKLTLTAGSYSFSQYRVGASIKFGGVAIATRDRETTDQISLSDGETVTLLSGEHTIKHNSNGSKSLSVAYALDMASTSYTPGALSGAGTMTLTEIPRASTIGATDAYVGAASSIAITKKSSAYKHSIAYQFGELTGYIGSGGGTSATELKFAAANVAFKVPVAWYEQIPNAKTGVCTLTCTTYSGTTQIGEPQTCTFTVRTDSAECAPTVTGAVVDTNEKTIALTGDSSKLVRYFSEALCTIDAAAKHGASIASKAIGGVAVTGDTRTISGIENGYVYFKATDSRGYSTSLKKTFTLVKYVKLTNNATCTRDDPTSGNATIKAKGKYFEGSFGAANNSLTVEYQVNGGDWVTVGNVTIADGAYSASVALTGLDYQSSHTVKVRAKDALRTLTKTVTVKKGIPIFDWGENDFWFNVPLYLMNGSFAMGAAASGLKVWTGTVSITPTAADTTEQTTVAFPTGFFTAAPYVFVSPATAYPGTVRASAYGVTTDGAGIYLHRHDTLVTYIRILAVGT